MTEREIVYRLREEYFDNLPTIRRVAWQLETEIRYLTLPIMRKLEPYQQMSIKSRVKECDSAVKTLREKQEGDIFDPDEEYSILSLNDLAGVRVLVFPRERLIEADEVLRSSEQFRNWTSNPIPYGGDTLQAPKYFGTCESVSVEIRGEYQVVPMLIGNFWEVEHSAMYKPSGWAKGIENDPDMKMLRADVESSLTHFEEGFETFLKRNSQPPLGTL